MFYVNVNANLIVKKQKWNNETYQCECKWISMSMDIVLTKKRNTIATKKANVTSTASISCYSKKVRDCYILHTVLLVILLLCIKNRTCYYFDDIIKLEDFSLDNILRKIDEKSHENILIYNISY